MTNEIVQKNKKNRHRYNKQSRLVSFEEEVVPKNAAEQILLKETPVNVDDKSKKKKKKGIDTSVDAHEETVDEVANMHEVCENSKSKKKKKKKTKIEQSEGSMEESIEPKNEESKREHKQKRNAAQITRNEETESVSENVEIGDGQDYKPKKKKKKNHDKQPESDENGLPPTNTAEKKKEESIRAQKRKKHVQLLEEKKVKKELHSQQESLNYLSKWKHTRDEWKFEKLRQIWLLHNLYDSDKIPQEFWETLLEYFNNAQGKVRDTLLKEAVKIVEENSEDTENSCKVERARDIIQNLQE
ncbi:hypothetical protein MTP99_012114 [Tenebrio molitor]|jgi:hypothetical protein|nr:hypothetical protein MTP99_012114 [Tenebrio molitor]